MLRFSIRSCMLSSTGGGPLLILALSDHVQVDPCQSAPCQVRSLSACVGSVWVRALSNPTVTARAVPCCVGRVVFDVPWMVSDDCWMMIHVRWLMFNDWWSMTDDSPSMNEEWWVMSVFRWLMNDGSWNIGHHSSNLNNHKSIKTTKCLPSNFRARTAKFFPLM